MNRIALLATAAIISISLSAEAKIPAIRSGDGMIFDLGYIPAQFKEAFDTLNRKCVRCHSMERVVTSVQTGRAQVTGQPFEKQSAKAHGIKLLRDANSGMSRHEIREVVAFLCFLIDENRK